MWTIPEVYTKIPQVNVTDYRWYVISFMTFKKLKQIDFVLKSFDASNFVWVPAHDEYKRLQSRSNQVITIDKPNYPNYGFIAVKPGSVNIGELAARINYIYFAMILKHPVFEKEIKQVFEVAYKYNVKKSKPAFKPGSYVLLTSGAFFGMRAKVVKIEGIKAYLEISMGQNTVQIITNIVDIVNDDSNSID